MDSALKLRGGGEYTFSCVPKRIPKNGITIVSETNENSATILYELFPFNRKIKTYILDGSGIENPYALDQKQNGTVVVVGSTTSADGLFPVSYGETDIFIAFWD